MEERNRRRTGARYERRAARFLQEAGARILEMNYRTRTGEIDIVAADGEYLVFVEVKYRRNLSCGHPLSAVNHKKRRQIVRTAREYLYAGGYPSSAAVRFDCVAILGEELSWIKNAFSAD